MLTGVLSDDHIKNKCWEITTPLSLSKRVGAKPITVAPSGNMRNSFTFQSPQPTIMNLATNILSITPKKNLPTNSSIVYSIAESLVRSEYSVSEMETQTMIQDMEENGTQTLIQDLQEMETQTMGQTGGTGTQTMGQTGGTGTQTMGQSMRGMGSQTGERQLTPVEIETRRRFAIMYPGRPIPPGPASSRTTSTQYQPEMSPSMETQTSVLTREIRTQTGGFRMPVAVRQRETVTPAQFARRQREQLAKPTLTSAELAILIANRPGA